MGRADWRSASNYAATFELDRGGFSWELLRRNPNYRRDYDQGVSHTLACGEAGPFPAAWGCDFAADPAIADQPIFWTEAALPAVLRFSTAPAEQVGRSSYDASLLEDAAVRRADDGLHAVWRLGLHRLQGRLDGAGDWRDAAVILPLDDALDLRALTAMRLARWLRRRTAGPDPAPLSVARRMRLVQVLRALDARLDGASLRDIAEGLFGRRLSGRAWQDSDLQARTRRLVRSGVALSRGGYRDLLNPLARARRRLGESPRDEGAAP